MGQDKGNSISGGEKKGKMEKKKQAVQKQSLTSRLILSQRLSNSYFGEIPPHSFYC